jgi:hypothetical protein
MANMNSSQNSSTNRLSSLLVAFLIVVFVFLGLLLIRQRIFDWMKLHNYVPPASIAELANEDMMNSYTKHVFYVNHPDLISTVAAFRIKCPEDETDIVLGCYHVGQNGIFIYQVPDQSLNGVSQVTAAHEVLHAIYARLSSKNRTILDQELTSYYKHGLVNQRVVAEIQLYQKTEPRSVFDEMSCTFGTEIANLPSGLNNYYKQFFANRQVIVAYEQQYQSAFSERQNQVASDDQQLQMMKQQIDTLQQSLVSQSSQITAQRTVLQNLMTSNPIEYDQEVPEFNTLVGNYNSGVGTLHTDISAYNQLVITRNSIAGAFDTLLKAINTSITAQPHK